jgi:transcriptional regulator with XRE-family HTH domain
MLSNLKAVLAARRMRQFELAAALGISPSTLTEIILDRREADAELRARIALILKADEAFLFQRVTARPLHIGAGTILAAS